MRIAVLDLGSTTFHLEHFAVLPDGSLATTLDHKRSLRVGDPVFTLGRFDAETIEKTLDAVEQLLACSARERTDRLEIVATSPFRAASNGPALAAELERRFGARVEILAARDEARLAYLGNSTLPELRGRRAAVVDLGGGSAELAVGEGSSCSHAMSLPIGPVRLRKLAARSDDPCPATPELLRASLSQVLREPMSQIVALAPSSLVFASGTARAVRALVTRGKPTAGKVGPLSVQDLARGLREHAGCTPHDLLELGVDAARADTVLIAAVVMSVIAELSGAGQCLVSDRGLRSGVAIRALLGAASSMRAARRESRPDWAGCSDE